MADHTTVTIRRDLRITNSHYLHLVSGRFSRSLFAFLKFTILLVYTTYILCEIHMLNIYVQLLACNFHVFLERSCVQRLWKAQIWQNHIKY